MRILNLARRFSQDDWGGTETVVLETSKALVKRGHWVQIYSTLATASSREDTVGGIPVKRFSYFYPYLGLSRSSRETLDRKGGSPFSFSLLRALNRLENIDIIHIHAGNRIGGIGRYVALKKKIPYFVTLHGGHFNVPSEEAQSWSAPTKGAIDLGKPLGLWVGSRRLLQDAAAVICVDMYECKAASEHLPNTPVLHIPNGVDFKRFQAGNGGVFRKRYHIPSDAFVILTVARIDSQKNQMLAVKMLPALLKKEPRLHLVFVGSPTNKRYLSDIKQTIHDMGIEAHVTIVPGVPGTGCEIVDAYHSADLFFLPSRHETFGVVVIEAWAAGLPVVASRIGGIPAFVDDGVNGLLFENGNEEEARKQITALLDNPDRRNSIAEAGTNKVGKEFSWSRVVEQMEHLYENALSENPLCK